MRQWKLGRITLALTLIFIGVSVLLSFFYNANYLYWALKFWPVVIIILGVEILISAFLSDNEKIKVKIDVVSIILTIVFLGIFTVVGVGSQFAKNFKGFEHFGINFSNYDYSKTVEKKLSLKDVNTFEIENRYGGEMDIEASEGNVVEVTANVTFRYNDEKLVNENLEKSFSLNEGTDSKISVNNIENKDITIEKVDFKVKVPKKVNLNLKNNYGNIKVSSIQGDLNFDVKNGEADIKDVSGKIIGTNGYGNTKVYGVSGDVELTTKNGEVEIKNVSGNLKVENSYGKTSVENITGNTEISANNGEVVAKNVKGTSDISSKYGEVSLKNLIKGGKIEGQNGNIKLVYTEKVQGDFNIKASYGGIKLKIAKDQEGTFNCITQHGSVDTSLPLQKSNEDNEKSIKGTIGAGTNAFNITSKNGNISID